MDDEFLARRLDTLDGLHPVVARAYAPTDGGGYELTAEARAAAEQKEAELAAARARADRVEGQLEREVVRVALHAALRAAGVQAGLLAATVAMLRQTWNIEVTEVRGELVAQVRDGGRAVTIEAAVQGWLVSDADAAHFLDYRQQQRELARRQMLSGGGGADEPGPATAAIRRMFH